MSSTPVETSTSRINNPQRLYLLRWAWILIVLFNLGLFTLSIPAEYRVFRDDERWAVGYQSALNEIGVSPDVFATYITLVDILVVMGSTLLAVAVFRQRSDDWVALLVSATMVIYAASLTLAFYLTSPPIATAIRAFIPALIIWVISTYPDGRFVPQWTKWLIIALALISMVNIPLSVAGLSLEYLGWITFPVGIIILLLRYRNETIPPAQRQQVKWLLWGALSAFFAVTIYFLVPILFPALSHIDSNNPVYSVPGLVTFLITNSLRLFSSLIFVVSIGLSIIRYRLWDIDLTINRSLVYGTVTLGLVMLFLFAMLLLRIILGEANSGLSFAISALGAGAVFNPARKQAQNFVDRRFYGFRFDLNQLAQAQKLPEVKNPGALTGRKLGAYTVLDVIGKGGMGEVYKGQSSQHIVALKILLDTLAQQEEFYKRFKREIETLTFLNHPNIVKLFDSGTSEGIAYIAMEFIDGQELGVKIKEQGTLSIEEIRDIFSGLSAGLDYAHAQGLVHRDIKPSNIMLRSSPNMETIQAVLMDFGIAKIQDAQTSLTGTGAIGTIDYMAPEQIIAAKEVDHRADIYALGVMLYEMLTGEKPFKGSPAQVMFAHIQQPAPNPMDINTDLPRPIAKVILKALEKHPEDRFQSAGELAQALNSA